MRAVLAVLAALALAAPAAAAEIKKVDTSGYPQVSVTVLGSRTSAPALHENGTPPAGLDAQNVGRSKSVVLAVDRQKALGEEEMKILLSDEGTLRRIGKDVDPASAAGDYIGLALIEPGAAGPLADALETTWRRDPSLYYEDGFQEYADRGGRGELREELVESFRSWRAGT